MDPKKAMDRVLTSMRGSKSVKDFTEEHKEYPNGASNYNLLQECGQGVSATVYRALCIPNGEIVAVKLLDLESMNCRLEEVTREAQTMRLHHHPNVLSLYTSFLEGQHLWFVMPYIRGGSVLNIMKYRYKDGVDELVIAIIMKEVAKALEYVHKGGGIHRDVKAGNILVDDDGSVKLADFGVAATLERGGSWGLSTVSRNTFVGTPCWMAPEVMEQTDGYDARADIWSFGITLLELAHGHAPFAKYPPMKVLMMTIQNPPPQLEEQSGHRVFGKHVRELVANCLQKDPTQRPSASQLLESRFFKNLPDTKYLLTHLLQDLPQLTDRVRITNSDGKLSNPVQESLKAKEEYVQGMSGWDFTGIVTSSTEQSPSREPQERTPAAEPTTAESVTSPRQSEVAEGDYPPSTSDVVANAQGIERPWSPESVTSPTSRKAQGAAGKILERNGGYGKKTGSKSRFTVVPEDRKPEHSKSAVNGPRATDSAAASVKSDDGQGEDDESKKIGRFAVEVTKVSKVDKKSQKSAGSTTAEQGKAGTTSFVPPATVLQRSLAAMLEVFTAQQTELQKIVEALKEADKGKVQPLQNLLSGATDKKEDRILELERRVKELEAENKSLREQNEQLDNANAPGGTGNGPLQTTDDS